MKHIKKALAGVLASAAMATASAAPIPVATTFTPAGGPILVNSLTGYDFVLDMRNLFTVGTDVLSNVALTLNLRDTDIQGQNNENIRITLGNLLTGQVYTVLGNNNVSNGNSTTSELITLNLGALADLALDGLLSVRVAASAGDFLFLNAQVGAGVTLVVEPPPPGGQVPEPFTLGLIGIALAGAGLARRRRN